MQAPLNRRAVLVSGGAAVLSLAGCLGDGSGASRPQEREYTLTIDRPAETIELQIEPAGDVADVIQINVGDTVGFTIVNEADVPVGLHNHANDAEHVLEPGAQQAETFEATEAMTGRQEIEGWVVEHGDDGTGGHDERDGEHGEAATTLAVIEIRPRGS